MMNSRPTRKPEGRGPFLKLRRMIAGVAASKPFLITVSALAAIVCWSALVASDGTLTRQKVFANVAVSVTGDAALKSRGYIVMDDILEEVPAVKMTVEVTPVSYTHLQVGVDGFRAQLLPEQKAEAVLRLQTQGNGVVMVGDGINDAPALAYADVGISLGSKSTDIAMETSDVVISRDDPMMIPELRKLSRATMHIVQQNFAIVIGINTVGLILGAASGISVMMSALMHNARCV